MRVFSQRSHKFVELGEKFLFHVIRPSAVVEELGYVLLIHHFEQCLQIVLFDDSIGHLIMDCLLEYRFILTEREFQKISEIHIITIFIENGRLYLTYL